MGQKMMSPNTALYWIPTDATVNTGTEVDPVLVNYDPESPKVGFFTDDRNISCAVVTGYTLNPTKSTTDASKSICDAANPTSVNYEGNLTFFREADLADAVSAYARAFEFFKQRLASGYLVRRTGYKSTIAVAAGHVVSSFKFLSDNAQDVVGEDAPIQFTVPFKQQAGMHLFKSVVA
jgi:hypothetical protein